MRRIACEGFAISIRKRMTPLDAGSLALKASSPKSLSKVSSMRSLGLRWSKNGLVWTCRRVRSYAGNIVPFCPRCVDCLAGHVLIGQEAQGHSYACSG